LAPQTNRHIRDAGCGACGSGKSVINAFVERTESVPGSVAVATLEGTRPMLIEIQALVCPTSFGMPRRMATGLDYNRITLLMAVLEKRVGMQLHNYILLLQAI